MLTMVARKKLLFSVSVTLNWILYLSLIFSLLKIILKKETLQNLKGITFDHLFFKHILSPTVLNDCKTGAVSSYFGDYRAHKTYVT